MATAHSSQVKSTLFPTNEFTSITKIQFSITEINIEIVIKNELKHFLMSEGNTSV